MSDIDFHAIADAFGFNARTAGRILEGLRLQPVSPGPAWPVVPKPKVLRQCPRSFSLSAAR
jgi:hypothetical protein